MIVETRTSLNMYEQHLIQGTIMEKSSVQFSLESNNLKRYYDKKLPFSKLNQCEYLLCIDEPLLLVH